jgi:hypothetical protein
MRRSGDISRELDAVRSGRQRTVVGFDDWSDTKTLGIAPNLIALLLKQSGCWRLRGAFKTVVDALSRE